MQRTKFWDLRRCRVLGLALSLAWAYLAFPPISFEGTFWAGLTPAAQMALRLALVGLVPSLLIPLVPHVVQRGRSCGIAACAAVLLWISGWLGNVILDAAASLPLRFITLFCTGAGSAYFLVYWGLRFCHGEEESSELDFVAVIVLVGALVIAAHVVLHPVSEVFLIATPLLQGVLLAAAVRNTRSEASEGALRSGTVSAPPSFVAPFGRELTVLLLRTALSITLVSFVWCMFSMKSASLVSPDMYLFGFGFLLAGAAIWLFVKFSPSIGFVAATRWVLPMMALGLLCNAGSTVGSLIAACLLLSMAHATFEMLLRMQAVRFGRQHPDKQVMAVGWGFSAIMLGAFAGPSLYLLVMDSGIVDNLHLALWVLAVLVVVGSVLFAMPPERIAEERPFAGEPSDGGGRCGAEEAVGSPSTEKSSPEKEGPGASASDEAGPSIQQRAQQLAERFGLTAREREILTLLLEGRSRPYIRDTLYLSISTVDTHIRHIYAKAGVHNKQELIDLSQAEAL